MNSLVAGGKVPYRHLQVVLPRLSLLRPRPHRLPLGQGSEKVADWQWIAEVATLWAELQQYYYYCYYYK